MVPLWPPSRDRSLLLDRRSGCVGSASRSRRVPFALGVLTLGGEIWLIQREGGSVFVSVLLAALAAGTIWAILLAHELGHALVARSNGARVTSIRFHGLGAVTYLAGERLTDCTAARIVIAGPLVTAWCYAVLVLVAHIGFGWSFGAATLGVFKQTFASYSEQVMGLLLYTTAIVLVGRLLPVLPMDGGRLVIVKLTHWMDDETLAVKLAASIGMVTAGALMIASAGHIETLIGPLFFLAGYALAVGGRAYFILLHPPAPRSDAN